MNVKIVKFVLVAIISIPMMLVSVFNGQPTAASPVANDDAAAIFKAKCAMCHGPTAAKAFDPALPEAELVNAILKGKKGEKPPYMPEYESKGITEETAKALVAHMKSLRAGGN
ncbi:MAG: cytochrome c [Pyrinomonadaceae bacterium]|jgi:cytochrome c553|nr:cytochrome c [Blastocatellia bacterium]MCW5955962.1 cytochrome c [Pyrinomonadaceae bacterium]